VANTVRLPVRRAAVNVSRDPGAKGTGKEMQEIFQTSGRAVKPSETIEIRYALRSNPKATPVPTARLLRGFQGT